MTKPAVSVVVPVHNRRRSIRECVQSALDQSTPPKDVVVVDDGSTDGSTEAVEGLRGVRIIRQPHAGRSAARNAGIRAAQGELIAFLDSDDVWMSDKLARQLVTLQDNPGAGLLSGHVLVTDGSGAPRRADTQLCKKFLDNLRTERRPYETFIRSAGIFTSTVLVPRRVFDEVGLFDESLDANEDWDLWLRILRNWPLAVTPWPPVVRYRVHRSNTPAAPMARGTISAIHRHLDAPPRISRRARALMFMRLARAHRTLRQEREARKAIGRSLLVSPGTAVASGAIRLMIGSFIPRRLSRPRRSRGGRA